MVLPFKSISQRLHALVAPHVQFVGILVCSGLIGEDMLLLILPLCHFKQDPEIEKCAVFGILVVVLQTEDEGEEGQILVLGADHEAEQGRKTLVDI